MLHDRFASVQLIDNFIDELIENGFLLLEMCSTMSVLMTTPDIVRKALPRFSLQAARNSVSLSSSSLADRKAPRSITFLKNALLNVSRMALLINVV